MKLPIEYEKKLIFIFHLLFKYIEIRRIFIYRKSQFLD